MITKIKSYDEQIVEKLNEIIDWINAHEVEESVQMTRTFTDPTDDKKLRIDDSWWNHQPTYDNKGEQVGRALKVVYDRIMNEKEGN